MTFELLYPKHFNMGIHMKKFLAGLLIGLLISVVTTAIWFGQTRTGSAPETAAVIAGVPTDSIVSEAVNPAFARASAMFEEATASPTVPGISVAIAGKDGVIWSKGFGWADIENRVAMSTRTKMRIGSVAKPFTAAALMRLYDQGKIELDIDVRTYVPAWPEKHASITLRQLASHTSGIRHYENDEFMSNRKYPTVIDSLDIFKESPL